MSKLSLRHPNLLLLENTDGVGVIPPTLPYGLAITYNSDGYDEVDFWNLANNTGTGNGFYFQQKLTDTTKVLFASLDTAVAAGGYRNSELVLNADDGAVTYFGLNNAASGVPSEMWWYSPNAQVLGLYTDDGAGVIPNSSALGLAITHNADGFGEVDFWNLTNGTEDAQGFYFHQKSSDGATGNTFAALYSWVDGGGRENVELDLQHSTGNLNIVLSPDYALFNAGGGANRMEFNFDTNVALTLNDDLSAVFAGPVDLRNPAGHVIISAYGDGTTAEIDLHGPGTSDGVGLWTDASAGYVGTFGSIFPLVFIVNAADTALTLNTDKSAVFAGPVTQKPLASATPVNNGDLVIQRTSNTQLTFKLKGSDGIVRSGNLTLT